MGILQRCESSGNFKNVNPGPKLENEFNIGLSRTEYSEGQSWIISHKFHKTEERIRLVSLVSDTKSSLRIVQYVQTSIDYTVQSCRVQLNHTFRSGIISLKQFLSEHCFTISGREFRAVSTTVASSSSQIRKLISVMISEIVSMSHNS